MDTLWDGNIVNGHTMENMTENGHMTENGPMTENGKTYTSYNMTKNGLVNGHLMTENGHLLTENGHLMTEKASHLPLTLKALHENEYTI
jgi:hypothetical protein